MLREHHNILLVVEALEKDAHGLKNGQAFNVEFYLKFIDFQRNYVDKFHHVKEEEILFPFLEKNESTADKQEIILLVHQHLLTRAHVENIEKALEVNDYRIIAANAVDYCNMIREHIEREDKLYFPLVEKLLSDDAKKSIMLRFEANEAAFPVDTAEKYVSLANKLRELAGLNR